MLVQLSLYELICGTLKEKRFSFIFFRTRLLNMPNRKQVVFFENTPPLDQKGVLNHLRVQGSH